MTIGGWILMSLSCGTVTGLMVFCYYRLLRNQGSDSSQPRERNDAKRPR